VWHCDVTPESLREGKGGKRKEERGKRMEDGGWMKEGGR
jgi:hypothetical protein